MITIYKTLPETMTEVQKLISENRFVSVRPAWVYNPALTDYDKQYIVEDDYITVRGVDEIIGSKSLADLKAEIIEIQRESQYQSQVVSELNKRYNASPDEINLMLFRTGTQVPRRFRSLSDYKDSGEWNKPWKPTPITSPIANNSSNIDLFRIGDSITFTPVQPTEKTTKTNKKNKK